ncbi:MAG TPA: pyridoxal phosphate-dependent aminotransferase [candidate division Zixibacteria bacterium]|nr:pyridoxal phosphate-dependent aminotransferase [candidate division Zixibacteria bacterium]
MRKRIIIDKADRLYQMPHPVEEFYPHAALLPGRRQEALDLARPRWWDSGAPPAEGSATTPVSSDIISASDAAVGRLKETIADWVAKELSLKVDPVREVFVDGSVRRLLSLAGMAYLDPGDLALYPNPGYPIYRQVTLTYGAEPVGYHLTEKRDFKPRLKQFSERIGKAARIMFLNNPHNPSGAELDSEELDELLWLAARDNILLISDAAYYPYRDEPGCSILGSASGRRIGLEFYSLSYLTGAGKLPLGFALGSKELIAGLQSAANVAGQLLTRDWVERATRVLAEYPAPQIQATRSRIRQTRPAALNLCEALSLTAVGADAFPYLLARIPQRTSSQAYAAGALRKYGVVTLPGAAFGDLGEGYVRLTTTTGPLVYEKAVERIEGAKRAV